MLPLLLPSTTADWLLLLQYTSFQKLDARLLLFFEDFRS